MVSGINSNYYNPYQKTMLEQTYYNPISYQNPNLFGGVDTTAQKEVPADGKDDGSIGFFSALGHTLKGGVKFVTGMFTDENGDFSLKQTLKTVGIGALIGAATFIPVVGPLVLPTLCAYGMLDGGLKVAKGFVNAMDAKTDAEAEKAWEEVGSGTTEGVLSYVGYKQTGGFSKGWNQAKAEFNSRIANSNYTNTSTPTESTSTSPKSKLDKAKAKEPQGPKHNELAESARRDIINEKAAKVDAGESINPTNAEIAEQGKNLNTQHLNSKDAKLVEKAYNDVPTAKQQAAYDKEIAYQEPTKAQRNALDKLAEQNKAEYAEAHKVENNIKPQEAESLTKVKEQLSAAEAAPKTITNGEYFLDGNRYVIKDGKIVEMQLKGSPKPQTKELAIAKHEAKSNILERILNGEASKNGNVEVKLPTAQKVENPTHKTVEHKANTVKDTPVAKNNTPVIEEVTVPNQEMIAADYEAVQASLYERPAFYQNELLSENPFTYPSLNGELYTPEIFAPNPYEIGSFMEADMMNSNIDIIDGLIA